jgi:TonB family protein
MPRLAMFLFFIAISGNALCQQPVFRADGNTGLADFLAAKIIYPEYSRQNCIGGTVKISFKLDKDGKVYDAYVSEGMGIDLDDEALRVVKLTSGKWKIPGDYHSSSIILPVVFQPDAGQCAAATRGQISLAIENYKVQQREQDVITAYYINKYAGKADVGNEAAIINLKKQLGFNDEYISEVLDDADQKLKQGDTAAACHDWTFIRNIGSDRADALLAKYCK